MRIYIVAVLLALLQATAVDLIAVVNIKPDLLLILVVFVALHEGPLKGAVAGAAAGFLTDMLSAGAFLNMFVFGVCGLGVGLFGQRFYRERLIPYPLVVAGASIFVSLAYLVWFSNWDYPPSLAMLALYVGSPTVLYTALISPPVFFIFRKIIPHQRGHIIGIT